MNRFIDIAVGSVPDASTYFITVHDNGAGLAGTDIKYTVAAMAAYLSTVMKVSIICMVNNTSLTNDFFSNPISEIVTGGQAYISGEDFTQVATTISWTNGNSFTTGQVILAKI